MIDQFDSALGKSKLLMPAAEVLMFRTAEICGFVTDLQKLITSNDLCSRLELRDTALYIPELTLDSIVAGIVSLLGNMLSNPETKEPQIRNFINTEVMDGSVLGKTGAVSSESAAMLIDACIVLASKLIAIYEFTHSEEENQYEFELLRITGTGALIVCRYSRDY